MVAVVKTKPSKTPSWIASTAELAPKPSESHSIIRIELRLSSALSATTSITWTEVSRS